MARLWLDPQPAGAATHGASGVQSPMRSWQRFDDAHALRSLGAFVKLGNLLDASLARSPRWEVAPT